MEVKQNSFFVLQHLRSESLEVNQREHSLQNNAEYDPQMVHIPFIIYRQRRQRIVLKASVCSKNSQLHGHRLKSLPGASKFN